MNCETVIRFSVLLVIGLSFLNQGCSSASVPQDADGGNDDTSIDSPENNNDEPPTTEGSSTAAGFRVNAAASLIISEAGSARGFSVVLDRAPAADVTLPIASTNTAEASVSPSSLTFTPGDWSRPQQVTVSGEDDFADDGDVVLAVTVGPADSDDPDFDDLEAAEVSVTNRDDDTAGVTVVVDPDITTSETGTTATFTIALNSQPTNEVTIAIHSEQTSELAVAPDQVTFDATNWNEPQTVTVTGLDDAIEDGDVAVMVVTDAAVSTDAAYSGLAVANVTVMNQDNDTQSFTIEPDDYTAGTALTNIIEAVSLTTALADNSISQFEVTAAEDGLNLEPTGVQVFGHEGIQFFNSDRRLRLDFTRPAQGISLSFAGGTFFETEVGVLQAFDASNTLLEQYTTTPRGSGQTEVMTISRPTADIAWAVAFSQDSFGRLDYLIITVAIAP